MPHYLDPTHPTVMLHGFAQSGKDTVAKILIEEYGYTRYAFADPIREALYRLDPMIPTTHGESPNSDPYVPLRELVDNLGWDQTKQNSEVRRLLQVFGTEVGRELLGQDVWIDLALKEIAGHPDQHYVITDLRFLNEAQKFEDKIGAINIVYVLVRRPGIGPVNGHVSDAGLESLWSFDEVIDNDGTLEDLWDKTSAAIEPYLDMFTPAWALDT